MTGTARRLSSLSLPCLLAVLLGPSCGGSPGQPTAQTPTPTPVPTFTITFTQDLTIVPGGPYYVKAGTKVIFANTDPYKPHTIQADNVQSAAYFGGMNTVTIPAGKTYEVVFDKVGAYDYTTGPVQPAGQAKIIVQ
jgi:hypothetical protein